MYDRIKALATRYNEAKDQIQTEEATKHSLVLPFIAALGYDVFNPLEVTPEFIADLGIKKGEKIDYAIKHDDTISMLIECKCCTSKLDIKKVSQLFRYYHTCKARIGILTNGIEYHFFADLDEDNRMDNTPFFTFNVLSFDEANLSELKRFSKQAFKIDEILANARELKGRAAIINQLNEYINEPTDNFVKCLLTDLGYPGVKTQQVISSYGKSIAISFNLLIKEKVTERLKMALNQNQGNLDGLENFVIPDAPDSDGEPAEEDDGIVTTIEEIEGYAIIKAIAREIIPGSRVIMRDAKNYCAILLDNNNRKPIVRLRFNNLNNKKLALFPDIATKKEEVVPVNDLDDIYQYAEQIKTTIQAYDKATVEGTESIEDTNDASLDNE